MDEKPSSSCFYFFSLLFSTVRPATCFIEFKNQLTDHWPFSVPFFISSFNTLFQKHSHWQNNLLVDHYILHTRKKEKTALNYETNLVFL